MNKVQSIKKGSQIIDQIFWELFHLLKTRRQFSELDLAQVIKKRARQLGASGMAFPPIVAFGTGSSEIHHWASKKKVGRQSFLMLDYGVKVNGYCSDFTRTLFLGQPRKIHENLYNLTLRSQLAGIESLKIGAYSDQVDFATRHVINQAGYGKYFTHGSGHGVSKKIHDSPSFKINTADRVAKHDVVTIEPGIYLPRRFGVRIEDMIWIKDTPEVLSRIPKDFRSMIIK